MDLSICIVNWNTKSLLRKCLKSIYNKTEGVNFEAIIVDNASRDGSVEMLKNEFPQCNTIPSKFNLGFSKGNNLAIMHARGKYILFLNPDTELKTNALYGMFKFLEDSPKYGAVGCKLLNEDDFDKLDKCLVSAFTEMDEALLHIGHASSFLKRWRTK